MSSKAKSLSKKVDTHKFPVEMCNTLLGSFLVSLYILQKTSLLEKKDLIKIYKSEKKNWIKEDIDEEKWMDNLIKVLNKTNRIKAELSGREYYDIEIPYGDIAFVQSNWNCLIAPYLDIGNKEGKQILPLRDDGFTGVTLSSGKIYPIEKEVTNNIES